MREPIPTKRWLHREEVDHEVLHGQPVTDDHRAEWERQLDLPRTRPVYDKDGSVVGEETYTTRELDRKRMSKAKRDQLDAEEDVEPEPIPEPEVRRRPIDPAEFAPRSGIRQVVNLVAKTKGWTMYRLDYARGPYIGAAGTVLSISDSVVLGAREEPALDGSVRFAVASWRDGDFDSAWIGTLKDHVAYPQPANAKTMKQWIKGIPSDPHDAVPAADQQP